MITTENLGIKFALNRKRRRRIKDALVGKKAEFSTEEFWALRNVNLTVPPGESLGIIGRNGSGKSTLLKLISRVLTPDEGSITVEAQVAPLLQLGTGFSKDLSGRANIYLNGAVHGINRAEMNDRIDAIVDFAELGEFIDTPIRHYSTGMRSRLGFAIVTQLDAPIVLLDEVLAVGDKAFSAKCRTEIRRFRDEGRTLVVVSHSDKNIQEFCDRAVYLKNGTVAADGSVDDVLSDYSEDSSA